MSEYLGMGSGLFVSEQPVDRTFYKTIEECLGAVENEYKIVQDKIRNNDSRWDPSKPTFKVIGGVDVWQGEPEWTAGGVQYQYVESLSTTRYVGQKFMIQNPPTEDSPDGSPREYWFKNGIEDSDLILYMPDIEIPEVDLEPVMTAISNNRTNITNNTSRLNSLSGETIPASLRDEFPYLGKKGRGLSVNEYADRAPQSPFVSERRLGEILLAIKDGEDDDETRAADGVYYIRD